MSPQQYCTMIMIACLDVLGIDVECDVGKINIFFDHDLDPTTGGAITIGGINTQLRLIDIIERLEKMSGPPPVAAAS